MTFQIAYFGDSIMLGNHLGVGEDLPSKVAALYPAVAGHYTNFAIGSTYANEDGSHTDGGQGATGDAAFTPGLDVNIAVFLFGANDIAAGFTGATYVSHLKTYALARRAAGYTSIVILNTLPNSAITSGGFESERLIGNTGMAVDGSFVNAFANIARDPTMGDPANNADATWYSDGVHPTDAGNDLLAPYIAQALHAILDPLSAAPWVGPLDTPFFTGAFLTDVSFGATQGDPVLSAGSGSFAITGGSVTLRVASVIGAGSGAWAITGSKATISWSGAPPDTGGGGLPLVGAG